MNTFGKKVKSFTGNSFLQLLLIIMVIIQIFPIVWLLYTSLKSEKEIKTDVFALPTKLHFENFSGAWNSRIVDIDSQFKNSVFITIITLTVLVIVASLMAYALAKYNFPGKRFTIFFIIIIMGIPAFALVAPLYYFIAKLGLLNHYIGLILPYVGFSLPFSVVLLHAYFRKFPNELIEAATIEGCSDLRTFLYIVVPISKGAISSVAIINFIGIWNEFLFSLIVMKNNAAKTLTVGIYGFKGLHDIEYAFLFAALVIALIPTVIFFVAFQRNFVEGMTLGSIKG